MVPEWARRAFKSHTDEALQGMLDREAARQEVENTRWYKLTNERLNGELQWAREQLEYANVFTCQKLQAYIQSIQIIMKFIQATKNSGRYASELLSERIAKRKPKSVDEFMEEIMGVPQ